MTDPPTRIRPDGAGADVEPRTRDYAALRHVARQPILDPELRTAGYELLSRSGPQQPAAIGDPDREFTDTASALVSWGLDALVGERAAFMNVTPQFFADESYLLFPPERLVLEVVGGTGPSPGSSRRPSISSRPGTPRPAPTRPRCSGSTSTPSAGPTS